MFMKPNRETRTRTLGDIINEKMTEKKTEIQSQFSDGTELIKVTKNLLTVYSTTNQENSIVNCSPGHQPRREPDVHRGGRSLDQIQIGQGAQSLQNASTGLYKVVFLTGPPSK